MLDNAGKVVREIKVLSEPEALVAVLTELNLPIFGIHGRLCRNPHPITQNRSSGRECGGNEPDFDLLPQHCFACFERYDLFFAFDKTEE